MNFTESVVDTLLSKEADEPDEGWYDDLDTPDWRDEWADTLDHYER